VLDLWGTIRGHDTITKTKTNMSELDEAWAAALSDAEQKARLAGRGDVADYLSLRNSNDLLRKAGADDPQRMLGPLLSAALDNSLRYGDSALTGPVARGDAGTVRLHIAVLSAVSPEIRAAYVAMARLTADRALAAGLLAPDDAIDLLDVLAGRREDAE